MAEIWQDQDIYYRSYYDLNTHSYTQCQDSDVPIELVQMGQVLASYVASIEGELNQAFPRVLPHHFLKFRPFLAKDFTYISQILLPSSTTRADSCWLIQELMVFATLVLM